MREYTVKLLLIFLVVTTRLQAQNSEIDRLIVADLKMSFPSIYFKHSSTEYATMPYSVDSCFKYIALNIKVINSCPIWRDSSETEKLTKERIKKLKFGLNKYPLVKKINIQSMGKAQKISQYTIRKATDSTQIQYLLSLNSVFDFSGVINPNQKKSKDRIRIKLPMPWWFGCWKHGSSLKTMRKQHKIAKLSKQKKQTTIK